MIIEQERIRLMNEGVIGTTGRTVKLVDENGNEFEVAEPEQIHTYASWKALNRQVKKGEKAITSIVIWKHISKQKEDEELPSEKMFMKKAYFFTEAQTEAI